MLSEVLVLFRVATNQGQRGLKVVAQRFNNSAVININRVHVIPARHEPPAVTYFRRTNVVRSLFALIFLQKKNSVYNLKLFFWSWRKICFATFLYRVFFLHLYRQSSLKFFIHHWSSNYFFVTTDFNIAFYSFSKTVYSVFRTTAAYKFTSQTSFLKLRKLFGKDFVVILCGSLHDGTLKISGAYNKARSWNWKSLFSMFHFLLRLIL